ncbi:hypothetical protein TIFTF001_050235 [Ficus carica]|uniref:Uncharacterized protein n=1 Tax=Ficus carica TaxID=3494 RepID=A0AA87ZB53_FICCA|nr:hypothetical protein TIFTF001_050235 [Ficus carica]
MPCEGVGVRGAYSGSGLGGGGGVCAHRRRWGSGDGKNEGGLWHPTSDQKGGLVSNLIGGKEGRAREREAVSRSLASDRGKERRPAYGTSIGPVGEREEREGRREREGRVWGTKRVVEELRQNFLVREGGSPAKDKSSKRPSSRDFASPSLQATKSLGGSVVARSGVAVVGGRREFDGERRHEI